VIASVLRQALVACGLPEEGIQLISNSDRTFLSSLLQREEEIDLVIPRGGEGLIRFVSEHSRIPVLKHYKGVCHVYLTASADPSMAVDICENAKVQRPSVCNAMETLLIDREAAPTLLPLVGKRLQQLGVVMHGCAETRKILLNSDIPVELATDADYSAEYLALELAIKIVSGLDEAAAHIRRFGSDHTESIITEDETLAKTFIQRVNSSCVMVNASTRFADGGELGLGAEIGISTTKLHSFGPMGLEDLTARKFIVFGTGQVRE
jgi:glutamate-5-semialdehyde dehydrogenase